MNAHSFANDNSRILQFSSTLPSTGPFRTDARSDVSIEFMNRSLTLLPTPHPIALYDYAKAEQRRSEIEERLFFAVLATCGLAGVVCAFA